MKPQASITATMLLTLLTLLATAACSTTLSVPKLAYIPPQVAKGPSHAIFTSQPHVFDQPYIHSINRSTVEWWWFEAITPDLATSLVIIFFTSTSHGFPLSGNSASDITSVFVSARLPDGQVFFTNVPASEGAIIASGGPLGLGAAATFLGAGVSFVGSPDLTEYFIDLNVPANSTAGQEIIKGQLLLTSTAPPHYVCTANLQPNQILEIFPRLGWINALPSAQVYGDIQIGNQTLHFADGALGYHDHNWMDKPFVELIRSWYWGHATLGPYSIVWYDGIDAAGKEHVSAYVSQGNTVLLASCSISRLSVRPKGGQATYPPQPGKKSLFEYLAVNMVLQDGRKLSFNATPANVDLEAPGYRRWTGYVRGGVLGEKMYRGPSAFEEFALAA